MATMKEDDEKDEKLVAVEDDQGSKDEIVEIDDKAKPKDKGDTEVKAKPKEAAKAATEEEDDGEDERLGDDGEADERQHETPRERKLRRRRAMLRDKTELRFLRERNEQLERRQSNVEQRMLRGEFITVEDRITQVEGQIREAEAIMARAIEAGAGQDVVEAQAIRDQLRDRRTQLMNHKRHVSEQAREHVQAQQRPERQAQPDVNPYVVQHARKWAEAHPWFKPDQSDDDSAVVVAIDNRLTAEGLDPTTQEYWEELDDRLRDRLPHRYKNQRRDERDEEDVTRDKERGTVRRDAPRMPSGNRGGGERALRPGEVRVSAERKEAMIQAGVWEDPVLRQKMLRRYAEFDRQARDEARR